MEIQPSFDAEEFFAYNRLGEPIWKKGQEDDAPGSLSTQHKFLYDDRGRLAEDLVTDFAANIDQGSGSIKRISRTYDALDRPLKVTSYDSISLPPEQPGTIKNELQYEYGRYSMVSKIYQEWTAAVNTGTSRKVQYAYQYPTDGTTALRRTSTTYIDDSVVVNDDYGDSGSINDTISRVSGKKLSGSWLFQESYQGLGRLVQRQYGSLSAYWDITLDRFGRVGTLGVTSGQDTLNDYEYSYM